MIGLKFFILKACLLNRSGALCWSVTCSTMKANTILRKDPTLVPSIIILMHRITATTQQK